MRNVEVDDERELESTELQVGKCLCLVYGQQLFNAFHFDDEALFDNEVHAIRLGQFHSLVDDRQMHLVLNMQAGVGELIEHAGANGAFQHPGTKGSMHIQRASNHRTACFVGP